VFQLPCVLHELGDVANFLSRNGTTALGWELQELEGVLQVHPIYGLFDCILAHRGEQAIQDNDLARHIILDGVCDAPLL
jgi:hypothetical protein